jgi:hypothetical protein
LPNVPNHQPMRKGKASQKARYVPQKSRKVQNERYLVNLGSKNSNNTSKTFGISVYKIWWIKVDTLTKYPFGKTNLKCHCFFKCIIATFQEITFSHQSRVYQAWC